jgi:hypothetical protein
MQASMGESSDNKENDQRLAEACRTYASQAANLKQKVLAANTNGSLAIKGEENKESSLNGNGLAESSPAEEVRHALWLEGIFSQRVGTLLAL